MPVPCSGFLAASRGRFPAGYGDAAAPAGMARWDGPAASQGSVFALRWRGMVVRGDAAPVRVALRLLRPGASPGSGVDGYQRRKRG